MKLVTIGICITGVLYSNPVKIEEGFKEAQLKYSRVRTAYKEQEEHTKKLFQEKKITFPSAKIYLRAFKHEQELELWAKGSEGKMELVKTFSFCASSGEPGPKRKQGDFQIPEGFYHIDRFNPWSSFFLSLGVNYPNKSDRILGYKANLGGDIFIHGECVTIGCIPLDDEIKQLYLIAVEAKNAGQSKIPVHIFPFRYTSENAKAFSEKYASDKKMLDFWTNLKPGYINFEKTKTIPKPTVETDGKYKFD